MARVVACGDDALRIAPGQAGHRHALASHLRACGTWTEVVAGRTTVTVQFDPARLSMARARELLDVQVGQAGTASAEPARQHVLAARFGGADGPDLETIAARNGLSPADLVRRLCAAPLRVDLVGFTPGFAYLECPDATLHADRLATPRSRVAPGSIGLITGQVGLYALPGPGGWPLVGRLCSPLFDATSATPFLLQPGQTVRLVEAGAP